MPLFENRHFRAGAHQPRGLSKEKLQLVDGYIAENINRPIRLEHLAAAASLSRFHFARQFKRSMNMPPARYVAQQRIECAKAALRAKERLTDIAYSCGFSSQSHFSTAFRKATGMTPAAFRAALRLLIGLIASCVALHWMFCPSHVGSWFC